MTRAEVMAAAEAAASVPLRLALVCAGLAWLTGEARAAELLEFEFSREKRRYKVSSVSYIDVPPPGVFAVLTDYDNLHRISNLVSASAERPPGENGIRRVYTHNEGCLAWVCRSVEKLETLEATPHTRIVTSVIPEQSDVAFGRSEWRLSVEGRGTRLEYTLETEINFWVPPVIGNYLIAKWLKKGTRNALARIEYTAWHTLYDDPEAKPTRPQSQETEPDNGDT